MAQPTIATTGGVPERRQRRRQDWASQYQDQVADNGSPGLAGTIDPLKSMDMADSQGWDISDSAPPIRPGSAIRLASMSSADGDIGNVTPAAMHTQSPQASVQPVQYLQPSMDQPVCVGPYCAQGMQPRIISERVTHRNGVPVDEPASQVGPQQTMVSPQPSQPSASQPAASGTATTVAPSAPLPAIVSAADYEQAKMTVADPSIPYAERAKGHVYIARFHRQQAAIYSSMPGDKAYNMAREHMVLAKNADDAALSERNYGQAQTNHDERQKTLNQFKDIALRKAASGTFQGATSELDAALGDTRMPAQVRIQAIAMELTEKEAAYRTAWTKMNPGQPYQTTLDVPKTVKGLTIVAHAHDIRQAAVQNRAEQVQGLQVDAKTVGQLMPTAKRAFVAAYPDGPPSLDNTLLHMGPIVTRGLADFEATSQGLEKPTPEITAKSEREAHAILAGLHKEYTAELAQRSQPAPMAATQPQPSRPASPAAPQRARPPATNPPMTDGGAGLF